MDHFFQVNANSGFARKRTACLTPLDEREDRGRLAPESAAQ